MEASTGDDDTRDEIVWKKGDSFVRLGVALAIPMG